MLYTLHGFNQRLNAVLTEGEFLENRESKLSCKSTELSSVISLDYEDFLDCLKQFPREYESYCQLKDRLRLEYQSYPYYCALCHNQGRSRRKDHHQATECPLVFLERKRQLVISRENVSNPHQKRETYPRIKSRRYYFDSLADNAKIRTALREYRISQAGELDNLQLPIELLLQESVSDE